MSVGCAIWAVVFGALGTAFFIMLLIAASVGDADLPIVTGLLQTTGLYFAVSALFTIAGKQ